MTERIKWYEVEKLSRKKTNKYNAVRTEYNGHTYDSKHEAHVAMQLDLLRKEKDASDPIVSIEPHPKPYVFIVNDVKITSYTPDFVVTYASGKKEIIDAKSPPTRKHEGYRIRKKFMKAIYGIEVIEM